MESDKQPFGVWKEAQKRLEEKSKGMGEEQIIISLLERLDAGTEKLNKLTTWLIVLTVVLALMTTVAVIPAIRELIWRVPNG